MADPGRNSTGAAPDTSTEDGAALERQRSITQAVDEGHDADIPSGLGYVLTEEEEEKRRHSFARKPSLTGSHDVEKEAAASDENDANKSGNEKEEPVANSEEDANVVFWDGPDDPANPFNWPTWVKVTNCALISTLTFITPLGSSIFAPGVPQLMMEFQSSSDELAAFVVSVYVLGFAFGPMLIAPLSEIYGRMPIYHICNVAFLCFLVGCALAPSLNALIAFRFLSGIFGSCPLTNGGGTIADMIAQEKRGAAMAAFSIGPLLGPIIGPVAGGFLAQAKGWRWVFWLLVILAGVLSIAMLAFARETYAPVILERKVRRLRKQTGNDLLRSKLDAGLSPSDYFRRSIIRPFKLLIFSPICIIFAIYIAIVYGYLYLMFTSITIVFEEYYGFSTSSVGLVYLGLGVGSMTGLFYFSIASDRTVKKLTARDGQGMKPEYRLRPLPVGAVLLPVGLFIYGWTAEYHTHWIAPIIGTAVMGVANIIIFMGLNLALVDTFTIYAASALAANTVVRSVAGAVLPLGGLQMYQTLGMGWGNSLLGFIAVAMIPVSILILRYGEYLRTKFPVKDL